MFKIALEYCHERHVAEDLIHDAFEKLLKNIHVIRELECNALTVYVVYTIRSVSFNYLKHKAVENRRHSSETDQELEQYTAPSAEEEFLSREPNMALLTAIAQLSPEERQLLEEKYFEELSSLEIGRRHGYTAPNVRVKLLRLRQKLQDMMKGEVEWTKK